MCVAVSVTVCVSMCVCVSGQSALSDGLAPMLWQQCHGNHAMTSLMKHQSTVQPSRCQQSNSNMLLQQQITMLTRQAARCGRLPAQHHAESVQTQHGVVCDCMSAGGERVAASDGLLLSASLEEEDAADQCSSNE